MKQKMKKTRKHPSSGYVMPAYKRFLFTVKETNKQGVTSETTKFVTALNITQAYEYLEILTGIKKEEVVKYEELNKK